MRLNSSGVARDVVKYSAATATAAAARLSTSRARYAKRLYRITRAHILRVQGVFERSHLNGEVRAPIPPPPTRRSEMRKHFLAESIIDSANVMKFTAHFRFIGPIKLRDIRETLCSMVCLAYTAVKSISPRSRRCSLLIAVCLRARAHVRTCACVYVCVR